MTNRWFLLAVVALQAVCAVFFVSEIVASVLRLPVPPIDWQLREFLEIGAALGLCLGVLLGAEALRRSRRHAARVEAALRSARAAFGEMLEERFDEWALTPAERDVALFAIKGFSTAEIADLRGVSEGTIKAQTAAIYRKAGVTGRPQLLGLFIEDLVATEEDQSPSTA